MLDIQLKIIAVKTTPSSLSALERRYERLRTSLAQIGYVSQGSVVDRSRLKPPRHGYQWTRKMDQKTVTVSLTLEQFAKMKEAVGNYRGLRRQLRELEKLSRRIIFQGIPHPSRRKRLSQKVLGTK